MTLSRRIDAAMGGEQIESGLMYSARALGKRLAGALLCADNCGKGEAFAAVCFEQSGFQLANGLRERNRLGKCFAPTQGTAVAKSLDRGHLACPSIVSGAQVGSVRSAKSRRRPEVADPSDFATALHFRPPIIDFCTSLSYY